MRDADQSISKQVEQVLRAVSAGEIAPDVGQRIISAIQALAQVRAVEELEARPPCKGGSALTACPSCSTAPRMDSRGHRALDTLGVVELWQAFSGPKPMYTTVAQ